MKNVDNCCLMAASFAALTLLSSGCMSPKGDTTAEKIESAHEMRDRVLQAVYDESPDAKQQVEQSAGYIAFSNFSVHPGLLSFATGYGLLVNNKTGKEKHQKWHRLTIGPGIAVKGLYALAIFDDPEVVERFEKGPWTVGGQVEAGFVFGDFGGSLDRGWVFNRKVHVHYVTHTGVALELELIGIGKVSNNSKLNEAAAAAP